MKKVVISILLVCSFQLALASSTQDALQQHRSKLAEINRSILFLRQGISSFLTRRRSVQGRLAVVEEQIGHTAKQLRLTLAQLNQETKQLTTIETKHDQYKQVLQQAESSLKQQIRAAYMLGRQPYLKVILNQESMATVSRYMMYYRYLSRARYQAILKIRTTLAKINQTRDQIQLQTQKLESIKAEEEAEKYKLQHEQITRHSVLKKINQGITTQQAKLHELEANKAELEHVIQLIQKESYYFTSPGEQFIKSKGHLPWPVRHSAIIQGYNQPFAYGRLRTTGVLLKASLGTDVHAIFSGKVAFAHWLRGYGLLTIVQHGKTYMTLYAHAESLLVHVGERVRPGQVIATVGDSGGAKKMALYFEIRENGNPLNPLLWLRKQN